MELFLLEQLTVVFAFSILALIICHKINVPPIVGFLLTGLIVGPHGLGLAPSQHEIEIMAEIGIVLLLFSIGIEFSLEKLLQIKPLVLLGGGLQVGLTGLATFALSRFSGISLESSILLALLVSLSSTALVLKLLQEQGQIDSLHGRTAFAILIFQDLVVVPFLLTIPLLAQTSVVNNSSVWLGVIKGALVLASVVIAAKKVVPYILDQVAKTKSRELFLLTVVVICFSVAFLTQKAGLSLALGALLAGLIISESDYGNVALSNVLPFQQIFTSLFFVSIGMMLNLSFVGANFKLIVLVTILIVFIKTVLVLPAGLALGFSLKTALLSGLALAQVGEFSFMLAREGLKHNLLTEEIYQGVLAVSILTLMLTPFMFKFSPHIADFIVDLPLLRRLKSGWKIMTANDNLFSHEELSSHLIIIGYGLSGEAVSNAAKLSNVKYVTIDFNPIEVQRGRKNQHQIVYGDATQEAVLLKEGAHTAKVAFVSVGDPLGTRKIVSILRYLNPSLYIVARSHLLSEIDELYKLGANEVVSAKFEVAVEALLRVLMKFLIPKSELDLYANELRLRGYERIRSKLPITPNLRDLAIHAPNLEILCLRVEPDSLVAERTLSEIALRTNFGVTLLAIKRNDKTLINREGSTKLQSNDTVVLMGPAENQEQLANSFKATTSETVELAKGLEPPTY